MSNDTLLLTVGDLSNAEVREHRNLYHEQDANFRRHKISSNYPDYFAEHVKVNDGVYFISQRSGTQQVWLLDEDRSLRQLSEFDNEVQIRHLSSAYHGEFLLGVAEDRLFVLDVQSQSLDYLTDPQTNISHPTWSASGEQVYYIVNGKENKELWQMDLASKQSRRLKKGVERVLSNANEPSLLLLIDDAVVLFDPNTGETSEALTRLKLDFNEDWQWVDNMLYWTKVTVNGAELSALNLETLEEKKGQVFKSGDTGQFSLDKNQQSLMVTYFLPDQTDIYSLQL